MKAFCFAVVSLAVWISGCGSVPRYNYPPASNSAREITRLDMQIQKAKARQYGIVAPKEMEKAERYLEQAKIERRRSTNLAPVWDNLSIARGYFEEARRLYRLRAPRIPDVLEARGAAVRAGALQNPRASRELQALDDSFRTGVRRLNRGREGLNWSRLAADYAGVEAIAVQERELGPARTLIATAREQHASYYAPKTLAEAQAALKAAETAIAKSPRRPRAYRDQVQRALETAQLLVGVNATAREASGTSDERIARELVARDRDLALLRGQLKGAELEAEMKGRALTAAGVELQHARNDLHSERELNQALNEVREKFDQREADVFREGDKLLIRLKAAPFAVGSAKMPEKSKPLLSKVKGVIDDLKAKDVVVQGHADATGPEAVNKKISKERAEAVAGYLERQTGLKKVEAVGLSDQDPISSNKSPAGRAANRRVDVVITP